MKLRNGKMVNGFEEQQQEQNEVGETPDWQNENKELKEEVSRLKQKLNEIDELKAQLRNLSFNRERVKEDHGDIGTQFEEEEEVTKIKEKCLPVFRHKLTAQTREESEVSYFFRLWKQLKWIKGKYDELSVLSQMQGEMDPKRLEKILGEDELEYDLVVERIGRLALAPEKIKIQRKEILETKLKMGEWVEQINEFRVLCVNLNRRIYELPLQYRSYQILEHTVQEYIIDVLTRQETSKAAIREHLERVRETTEEVSWEEFYEIILRVSRTHGNEVKMFSSTWKTGKSKFDQKPSIFMIEEQGSVTRGRITSLKPAGFGFIRMQNSANDAFFHNNDKKNKTAILEVGSLVEFKVYFDSTRGRYSAREVNKIEDKDTTAPDRVNVLQVEGNENCPFIKCSLEGILVRGLLDSGASISGISSSLFQRIQKVNSEIKIENSVVPQGVTADGSKINFKGIVSLPVKMSGVVMRVPLRVIEQLSGIDLVLGMNILKRGSTDYVRGILHLGGCEIKMMDKDEELQQIFSLKEEVIMKQESQLDELERLREARLTQLRTEKDESTKKIKMNEIEQEIARVRPFYEEFKTLFGEDFHAGQLRVEAQRFEFIQDEKTIPGSRKHLYTVNKKPEERQAIEEWIERGKKIGVIEDSSSHITSNIFAVKKPDELQQDGSIRRKFRIVIPMEHTNKFLRNLSCYLPQIEFVKRKVSGATHFSVIDVRDGFFNVPLIAEHRPFTAFRDPNGKPWQFKVLPMGSTCSPALFQNVMCRILADHEDNTVIYVDDVLIFSSGTREKHSEILKGVLRTLENANARIKLSKVTLMAEEVVYLGTQLTKDGWNLAEKFVSSVKECKVPTSPKELKSFIGLINWQRDSVPHFAVKIRNLQEVANSGNKFNELWNKQHEKEFMEIKKDFENAHLMSHPVANKKFILFTDACRYGVGGALTQEGENGKLKIVGFYSKALTSSQRRWSIAEREGWAVIASLKHFQLIISGAPVLIRADQESLESLLLSYKNDKFYRWRVFLMEFEYEVKFIEGHENVLADYLSRYSYGLDDQEEDKWLSENVPLREEDVKLAQSFCLERPEDVVREEDGVFYRNKKIWTTTTLGKILGHILERNPKAEDSIKENFEFENVIHDETKCMVCAYEKSRSRKADKIMAVIEEAQTSTAGTNPIMKSRIGREFLKAKEQEKTSFMIGPVNFQMSHFKHDEEREILSYNGKKIIGEEEGRQLTEYCHKNDRSIAHSGVQKLFLFLRSRYFWLGQYDDCCRIVQECQICSKHKEPRRLKPLKTIITSTGPLEKVHVDIWGHKALPKIWGFSVVLSLVDDFSRFVLFVPLKSSSWDRIYKAFEENWVLFFGMPRELHTDQGVITRNGIKDLQNKGINCTFSGAYRPQQNGLVERMHRELKKWLIIMNEEGSMGVNWVERVKWAAHRMNGEPRMALKGASAFEVVFKQRRIIAGEEEHNESISEELNNRVIALIEESKKKHDEKDKNEEKRFLIGDRVFWKPRRNERKLAGTHVEGVVTDLIGNEIVRIKNDANGAIHDVACCQLTRRLRNEGDEMFNAN